jgi:2-isopropylmalate synthase
VSVQPFFTVTDYEVVVNRDTAGSAVARAVVALRAGASEVVRRRADGVGPIHALDEALRACLRSQYPDIDRIRLCDYSVSVVDGAKATGARVHVLITATDGTRTWDAGCISPNIVEASFEALCSSVIMGLMGLDRSRRVQPPAAART